MIHIDKLLYRILLNYYYITIDNHKYKVVYPNFEIKYEAELLYEQIIEDNKFEKLYLNDNEIKLYLQINNIWSKNDEQKLKDCEKFLEETKVNLYLNFHNENHRKQHKKNIEKTIKDLDSMYNRKNSFNFLTIEDHATSVKNEFILMKTIYDGNSLVFNYDFYDSLEYNKLQSFIREMIDYTIKPNDLRQLVKSDLWRSYSVASILERDILNTNDDYRHLISLHKMYENVRQHPECPSNEIIDDDDALDGWFIYQNRKTEKEKKKNNIMDKFGNNIKKAGEVFLMTSDVSEKKEIFDLNEGEQKYRVKELINIGKNIKEDPVKWQNLPFVQRDLRSQSQKQATQNQKGK